MLSLAIQVFIYFDSKGQGEDKKGKRERKVKYVRNRMNMIVT